MKNMKKIVLLLVMLFCISIAFAQDEQPVQNKRLLGNGFSIKAVIGLPSAEFGVDEDIKSLEYDLLYGLQLGNQWYVAHSRTFGFGLMANWFDINGTFKSIDDNIRATVDASLLEFGPILTLVLTKNIAIDTYYNIRPTAMVTAYTDNVSDVTSTISGIGLTHALGGGFRWKALSLGAEYVFGDIEATNFDLSTGESFSLQEGNTTMSAESIRFFIGLKF